MISNDMLQTVLDSEGMSGLIFLGIWQLLSWGLKTIQSSIDMVNQLQRERADQLEKKLDACEKKHEEVNAQIWQLREDNGLLKGKVDALERINQAAYHPV
jgi:cell division protein FtsB